MIRITFEYTKESIIVKKPFTFNKLIELVLSRYTNYNNNNILNNIFIYSLNFQNQHLNFIFNDNDLKKECSQNYNELFVITKNLAYIFNSKDLVDINQREENRQKDIEEFIYNNNKNMLNNNQKKLNQNPKYVDNNLIKNEINEFQNKEKKYKEEIKELKEKIKEKEKTIFNLNEKIKENDNEKKQKSINDNFEAFLPKYDDSDPLKFYDIIININSIKDIVKGWPFQMNQKGNEMYMKNNNKAIKIGVIGNGNKGKSFLLSQISDIELPSGESIKTKGLSIKFPDLEQYKNRNIILLDSAGQETPVLNNEKNNIDETIDKNDVEENNVKTNEITEEERLTEKARDKLLTEFFLQNYIVKYSDILIIVVGVLTFSEQKLISKIKRTFMNLQKENQLIIVHNLQSYVTKKQVEDYIEETLKKSDTFDLEELKEISKETEEVKWTYFHEPKSKPKTIHLLFARHGSEAGNFYNKKTIEFIYKLTSSITTKEPLNLFRNIKDLFKNLSSEILETDIKEKDIILEEDEKNSTKKIKLSNINDANEIKLIQIK